MVNSQTETLDNVPDNYALWKGLGGNFDSLTQIINEFIDNSLSNFLKNDNLDIKKIFIRINQVEQKKYEITIEDTGSGIKDLSAAFSIGNQTNQESPLNEHGFGMKHALAAANRENDDWEILTRTEEGEQQNFYYKISAPFLMKNLPAEKINSRGFAGSTPTGTIIKFKISFQWLKTITRGMRGNYSNLSSISDVLAEDIGYTYGPLLDKSDANIAIVYKDSNMETAKKLSVSKVDPTFEGTINPGVGDTDINLGNGSVKMHYEFLVASPSQYKKHYLANMSTSGVEIRLNGRLLADNLFSEIWGIEKHNAYNYILIRIDIQSDNLARLPKTSTNKTSLLQDDLLLTKIYEWIRNKFPEPKRRSSLGDHEIELFKQLQEKKQKIFKQIDPSCVVTTEQYAFTSLDERIRVDLYQSLQNKITIYEGKKDKTTPKDVYQLLMYWDGLVFDKITVNNAILIAASHPDSVKTIVKIKNASTDSDGNHYNIELRNWNDEDIDYPN